MWRAKAARTCGYISSEKTRDPFCISPPPDFSLHHKAIGTDSIIIRSSRIDLHPCGSVPRKVGGWKRINKRGAEEKKKASSLEGWQRFSRVVSETRMVTGRQQFGDCVAGVPLMYPDRNQIQSRAAASELRAFYLSGSFGFFLALQGPLGDSEATYAVC